MNGFFRSIFSFKLKAVVSARDNAAMWILLLFTASLLIQGQAFAEDCNGECKNLSECPPIESRIIDNFESVKFCDIENSIVCCPKKIERKPYYKDNSELFMTKCQDYRKQVYPICKPQGLIIGGTKAEPKEFPFMALLGYRVDNITNWLCGGTLITSKYVVTAAHCFYSTFTPNIVRLGELDYNSTSDVADPHDFGIIRHIDHPAYNYTTSYNDISLILLNRVVTFSHYIAPACLPLHNGTEFEEFIATGWGATKYAQISGASHLLKVHLQRFEDDECKELIDVTDSLNRGLYERTQICAGSRTEKRDTCTGDSGGPLFVQHPDHACMFLLVGITSFGRACNGEGQPGVYTRVNLYVEWIEKVVWNAAALI